jgi:hypothetical protein
MTTIPTLDPPIEPAREMGLGKNIPPSFMIKSIRIIVVKDGRALSACEENIGGINGKLRCLGMLLS